MFEDAETAAQAIQRNVRDALLEDIGPCDWTALLIPAQSTSQAKILIRDDQDGVVLCGIEWFEQCVLALDPKAIFEWRYKEGDMLQANTDVCFVKAHSRALLSAERAALNFLQLLSGVATLTRDYVRAVENASPNLQGCVVLDTRKTLPGLRYAQKYAVRVGGGQNQRFALYAGILIKENHIAAAGSIAAVLKNAVALQSQSPSNIPIQIEVETLTQLEEALQAGAASILLDNFSLLEMQKAVALNLNFSSSSQKRAILEASGGVDLANIGQIAATGVDRISIGRLTKDVKASDYSLRILEKSA